MSIMSLKNWILLPALAILGCGGNNTTPEAPATEHKPEAEVKAAPQDTVKVVNGHDKVFSPEGWLKMEGDMKDGKRNGVWTSYTPKGRVKSRGEYRDGMQVGLSTVFRDNGALYYTGQYLNGKQVGRWEFYNEAGDLERTVNYDSTGAVINDPR